MHAAQSSSDRLVGVLAYVYVRYVRTYMASIDVSYVDTYYYVLYMIHTP